ncbi:MAG: hypothetical protein ACI9P7_001284, partial [Candidatus Azotimanducaceae bacterium]
MPLKNRRPQRINQDIDLSYAWYSCQPRLHNFFDQVLLSN